MADEADQPAILSGDRDREASTELLSRAVGEGRLTLEEWRKIYKKGLAEMFDDDFRAIWVLLTVWGEKPV